MLEASGDWAGLTSVRAETTKSIVVVELRLLSITFRFRRHPDRLKLTAVNWLLETGFSSVRPHQINSNKVQGSPVFIDGESHAHPDKRAYRDIWCRNWDLPLKRS